MEELARRGVVMTLAFVCFFVATFYTPASAQPYGITNRAPLAPFLNGVLPPAAPVIAGDWTAAPAFPNLIFTNALGLLQVPGTNLLCVWEREGRVWVFEHSPTVSQKKLVLDVSNQCQGWDDSGFLGLAFHPGFATNRYVFVYYTWVVPGTVLGDAYLRPPTFAAGAFHDKLVRYTMAADGTFLTNSETVFLDQPGNSVWHNGGGMFFHPTNGFLYWTDGDDAELSNTQVIGNKLLSGVFRIDVDKRGGSISHAPVRTPANTIATNYFIPNDNPFVGQSNVLEEYFCLGLRSPHRMTLDAPTGRIFIGDVGLASWEEVDVIENGESGINFQWAANEGPGSDLTPPYIGVNRQPILAYGHTDGNFAIIGGYVYRGSRFTNELTGKYIFGDNGSDAVWFLDESTVPATKTVLCTVPKGSGYNSGNDYTGLSSFGVDADGEIYMCVMGNNGSVIYTLARGIATNTPAPPALFSQLGAFTNLVTLAPHKALVPYDVNTPLWSDAAHKQRWIALPTNAAIQFYPTGEWTFPPGTVLFKNFELSTNDSLPGQRRRLETRILVRDTNNYVYGATYKWRADLSDADLIVSGTNENIVILSPTGPRTQTWYYPGRLDCLSCHNQAGGGVLGMNTRQQNGSMTYPSGVTDNQLRTLNHLGFFSPALVESAITNYSRLTPLNDTTATLETRARSYFDVNCAHCHRPGGVNALFDMRFDTPLASQNLINGTALNSLNVTNAKIIAPGSTAQSVLYLRDNAVGANQMPPLGKNVVDTNAMAVIAAWIYSLAPSSSTLPPPWKDADLGSALPGSAGFSNAVFTVTGSGADIGNTADAGNFVWQPISGDGQIIARVAYVPATDAAAKAGVMFRESLAAGARNIFAGVSAAQGIVLQQRATTDGSTATASGPGAAAPYWVKLERAVDRFRGFASPDGTNWTLVGSYTNNMATNALIGLAVTAHNASLQNQSVFDNVSLVFSNGQPIYVVASAVVTNATTTEQTFQFTAQIYGGLTTNFTGDTTDDLSGTVTANGENTAGGEVATKAFDNNVTNKWLDFANANPATRASWIQYAYAKSRRWALNQYTVTSANDEPARDPKTWTFLGSNNGGTNWTTLDSRTNQVFTNRFEKHTYAITNPSPFSVYRLQVSSVFNPSLANSIQIGELEFLGASPIYAWDFGDGSIGSGAAPVHTYTTNGNYSVTLIAADGFATATNIFSVTVNFSAPAAAQWLSAEKLNGPNRIKFSATGTEGATYIVEATTNLVNWLPVFSNTAVGGLINFTNTSDTNFPHRFYRLRTP